MIDERFTVDSNVLVYALDRAAGHRHEASAKLMMEAASQSCVLTLQALAEFYHVATRKGRAPKDEAEAQVADWQNVFPIVAAGPQTLTSAIAASRRYSLSFWDAMLWACAREAGCTLIISEDFQDGRSLGGVRFANPFRDAPA